MTDDPQPDPTAEPELLEPEPVEATQEEAEEAKPSGKDLVVTGGDPGPHEVLDRYDEGQIVEAIQGRMVRSMLYDFTDSGSRQIDLSYVGVLECVRELAARGAKIRVRPESLVIDTVKEDLGDGETECWEATVYAEEETTGYGVFGTYTQPKRMKLRKQTAANRRKAKKPVADDDTIGDKFARQKAINKAQRNALRAMVPERIRQALIATYAGDDDRVQRVMAGAGAEQIAELPPPLEDDEAKALVAECEALYTEIREISMTLILPPAYNWMLQRAVGSHEMLRGLRDTLATRLDEAKQAVEA